MNTYVSMVILVAFIGVNALYSSEPVVAVLTCALVGLGSVIAYQNVLSKELDRKKP